MSGPFLGQNSSIESTPATTPSVDAHYFDGSKFTSPASTPSATPSVASEDTPRPSIPRTNTGTVPALMRDFPKPIADLDVVEALARQPGRWTIKGQMEANEKRAKLAALNAEAAKQRRAEDFAATKKDLLASFQSRPATRPPGPPRPTTTF